MRVKMPKYILVGESKCIVVSSPRISNKEGTLMYSHFLLAREISIKACMPQRTENISGLEPR